MIIEGIMKGLAIWLYNLLLEIVEFIADALLAVFNMDMAYFESNVPVTTEIVTIIMGAGWALLIGNLTFQAIKSMMSGIGFEGEDPKILFTRTFVFSFLLLASRQICAIGMGMSSALNTFMQTPSAVNLSLPQLDIFTFPGSWLLVIIIGVVLMFQLIRFFFEMAERYVVLAILTIFAPLAFGVGGSKNTEDIFKGWVRIYCSACLMMVLNTAFLKLLLSAMSNMPDGSGSTGALLPWTLLVVGIARVARKVDDIVARIGLNTARTGDPLGRGGIMYPVMVARTLSGIVSKTAGAAKGASKTPKTGTHGGSAPRPSAPPPPPPTPAPSSGGNTPPNSPAGGASPSAPPPSGSAAGNTPANPGAYSPGTDSGTQPTRPPVGGFHNGGIRAGAGREQASAQSQQPAESEQSSFFGGGTSRGGGAGRSSARGFVSQGEFGGHGNNSPNDTAGPRTGGGRSGRANGSEQRNGIGQPPLSADTRTPGASTTPDPASGAKGYQRDGRYRKKPNIDIYRDDDPPARSSQTRPPASGNARPTNTQTGGAARQPTITPPSSAGTAATGKTPQTATGQAGTAAPQIPSAPMSAASPRGGRIRGGVTNPSGSNRAPSKAAPAAPASPVTAASDSRARSASQTKPVSTGTAGTETRRAPSTASSTPPPAVSANGRQKSGGTRYRIADRTIRQSDNRDSRPPPKNGDRPRGNRPPGRNPPDDHPPISRPPIRR